MAVWRIGGFRIVQHAADHWPAHVHVYRDDRFVGKYAYLERRWLEGPYRARNQAKAALAKWIESEAAP